LQSLIKCKANTENMSIETSRVNPNIKIIKKDFGHKFRELNEIHKNTIFDFSSNIIYTRHSNEVQNFLIEIID